MLVVNVRIRQPDDCKQTSQSAALVEFAQVESPCTTSERDAWCKAAEILEMEGLVPFLLDIIE